jgi:hypothetical protein
MRSVKKERLMVYVVTLNESHKALVIKHLQEKPLGEVNPKEYHRFLPLFSKVITETLPLYRLYDYKIKFWYSFTPPFGPIYHLSREEFQVLMEWIEKNFVQGIHFIILIALRSPRDFGSNTRRRSETLRRLSGFK